MANNLQLNAAVEALKSDFPAVFPRVYVHAGWAKLVYKTCAMALVHHNEVLGIVRENGELSAVFKCQPSDELLTEMNSVVDQSWETCEICGQYGDICRVDDELCTLCIEDGRMVDATYN